MLPKTENEKDASMSDLRNYLIYLGENGAQGQI